MPLDMKKKHRKIVYLSFEHYLAKKLKNKTFRRYYEEWGRRLEADYQKVKLQKQRKSSLVKKVSGTFLV